MGRFTIKRQARQSENFWKRLVEVADPEKYMVFGGQTLDQHVLCIHCGSDYLLGQALVDSDNLVKCASLLCDGSLIDMFPVKEEPLASMRARYGFTEPGDSAPLSRRGPRAPPYW
jgi:hypothetical protein